MLRILAVPWYSPLPCFSDQTFSLAAIRVQQYAPLEHRTQSEAAARHYRLAVVVAAAAAAAAAAPALVVLAIEPCLWLQAAFFSSPCHSDRFRPTSVDKSLVRAQWLRRSDKIDG